MKNKVLESALSDNLGLHDDDIQADDSLHNSHVEYSSPAGILEMIDAKVVDHWKTVNQWKARKSG